ncbi:hypothetical protein [Nocardia sp. NPDC005366]|uniref:hypothetical protein n=1 Tax=Nocardia sp. NPDC005366 TaxID=3156878 RepID=UPI0033A61515
MTLGGHGGSARRWPLSFVGTLAHVYGITVWLGGVAMIFLVLRGVPELRRWHAVAVGHVLPRRIGVVAGRPRAIAIETGVAVAVLVVCGPAAGEVGRRRRRERIAGVAQ